MTMVVTLLSHTILQKSPKVSGRGPCAAMYSFFVEYPCCHGDEHVVMEMDMLIERGICCQGDEDIVRVMNMLSG